MSDERQLTEEEARQEFLRAGAQFFRFNGGKNTPNILIQLNQRIEKLEAAAHQTTEAVAKLDASIRDASNSSTRLASALNKLTLAYLIVTDLGVFIAGIALARQIWF